MSKVLILKKINIDIEKLKEIKNKNPYTEFLRNKFPFDWTRNSAAPRLNLNELKNSEFHELEYNEINKKVSKIIEKNKIVDDKVIIIWNHTLNLVIELNFKDFIKYSNYILCDIWDSWVFSLENDWCIECTHDKELSFGRLKTINEKIIKI